MHRQADLRVVNVLICDMHILAAIPFPDPIRERALQEAFVVSPIPGVQANPAHEKPPGASAICNHYR